MKELAEFQETYVARHRVHTKSLISTIFGDMVEPNHGYIWVETLSAILAPLKVNERLVRTSLFRLREEEWVYPTRSGRKSYYQLTDLAKSKTKFAEQLIYYSDEKYWDGYWSLVFVVTRPIGAELKRELIQELSWMGFGAVTKNVWAHPGNKNDLVSERIKRLGLEGDVICMRAKNIYDIELGFTCDDRELSALCLPRAESEEGYSNFIKTFSPMVDVKGNLNVRGSASEFLTLRLIMMDEYRRVVLNDHHLPADLLPDNWVGHQAYKLCGQIYKKLLKKSTNAYCEMQADAGDHSLKYNRGDYSKRFSN